MNDKSIKLGIGITVIWLAVIGIFWYFGNLDNPDSINELGDTLAGIFAPVAFLWLVLGYVQQGKQLEQNTKSLEQQEEALQLQIDEFKKLTNLKELEEIQRVESCKPIIVFEEVICNYYKNSDFMIITSLKNSGLGDGVNIYITHEKMKSRLYDTLKLEKNENRKIEFLINENYFHKNEGDILDSFINVHCYDQLGNCYIKTHKILIFKHVKTDSGGCGIYISDGTFK